MADPADEVRGLGGAVDRGQVPALRDDPRCLRFLAPSRFSLSERAWLIFANKTADARSDPLIPERLLFVGSFAPAMVSIS